MSELPEPLRPWSVALSLFPRDLALELGAWLPRLSMAIGPLRSRDTEGFDEPDGFDGLSRRGPYERLLPAEWALAEAFPEEFIRRANSGEHAFFRLAFRTPAGNRRCLALLDCGPSQLGTPRLAQLAALMVLERRAREAGAEFLWGVLQQPAGRFLTGITASSVQHWLRARCATEPQPQGLSEWQLAFGGARADDETWLLGGQRLQQLRADNLLCIDPSEEAALYVDVVPRRGARREVRLPLPPDEVCTRLVRNPLKTEAAHGTTLRPASNLVFTGGGSRILYLTARGSILFT